MRYVALCLLALVPGRLAESVLDLTLARAAAYVRSYHQDFSVLVADEHYVQRSAVPLRSGGGRWALEGTTDHAEERTMRSEFMLVRGGGEEEMWLAFRDVLDVNGHATESQRGRLEQWLTQASGTFRERARALALEQARYNLGDIVRTINVPTLPLEFLLAERQARLRFKAAGEASFEERERPTLIRTPTGDNVPARGAFWIDPVTGRVFSSELRTGEKERNRLRATIRVTYKIEPKLSMLVPVLMAETYQSSTIQIAATARYSNYRRFETKTRLVR
ncbi:MAG: hypothetical protein H0U19_02690 [Acidobacteria bacterium]|nr:hypothetical protein [Acidobacteriota bacterium]